MLIRKVICVQVTKLNEPFPFTPSEHRSGIHVSAVLNFIDQGLGKSREEPDEAARLRMEVGFMWERALENAYRDRLGVRPGAIELDGIIGSPDGIDEQGRVCEYKLTWSSNKTPIEQRWRWMQQVMAYCKLCGTTEVVFRVLYLNGDYKKREPVYEVTGITFTQQEIDQCWAMIAQHAKLIKEREAQDGNYNSGVE